MKELLWPGVMLVGTMALFRSVILSKDLIEPIGAGEGRRGTRQAEYIGGRHEGAALAWSNAGGDDGVVHPREVGHQTTVVGTAEALAVCPLDADVRAVIEGHLQEHDLDEDLGFGTVEVREHLADILGGGRS